MKKLALLALLSACGTNDECRRLAELERAWDKTRVLAEQRASMLPKVRARASELEAASDKLVADSWLEVDDAKILAELQARIAKIPTATVSQSPAMVGATDEGDNIVTTEWAIRLPGTELAKVWEHVVALGQTPPLLVFNLLTKADKPGTFTLRLQKLLPIRSPFKPGKVPLEKPDDPSTVPTQLGFCGAGELRRKIAGAQEKIRAVEADAEATTILMASGPTAEGVRRRAEKSIKREREAREIMTRVVDGVVKEKLSFKAIGADETSVVIEVFGGPKELKALETLLLPFGDRVKPTELAAPGVVRRQIMISQPKQNADHEGAVP